MGGEAARRAAPWDGASTASPRHPNLLAPGPRGVKPETLRGVRTRSPDQAAGRPLSRECAGEGARRPEPRLAQSPGAAKPERAQTAFLGHRDPPGRELRLPGSQHRLPGGPGPARRGLAAPGPTKTSTRHATRPASVSLTPQECRNPRCQPRRTPDLNDFQRTELTLAAEPSPRPAGRP